MAFLSSWHLGNRVSYIVQLPSNSINDNGDDEVSPLVIML